MTSTTETRSGSTVTHGTFTLERTFPMSRQAVFDAWASREAKNAWFGEGDDFLEAVEEYTLEFRVGGRERLAGAVPAGKHHPRLRPAEHPGNRPEILDAPGFLPPRRAGANLQSGYLGKRRRLLEKADKLLIVVDEIPICRNRGRRHLSHGVFERGKPPGIRNGEHINRARQYGPADQLQLAVSHCGCRISGGDDFTLLRQLDTARHRSRWERQDGNIGRTPAAPDRTASAVKERMTHSFRLE
jgi:hypothetical protein